MQRPEEKYIRAAIELADLKYRADAGGIFHVRNEARHAIDRQIGAAMGVRAGAADLIILHPRGPFHFAVIECKAPGKPLRPDQEMWLTARGASGGFAACAWANAASMLLEWYMDGAEIPLPRTAKPDNFVILNPSAMIASLAEVV